MKNSHLYDYLEATGVLATGDAEAIKQTKDAYWKEFRKAWRKLQRKECQSFTVFYTPSEVKKIANAAQAKRLSTTAFIKQSAMVIAENRKGVSAIAIGEVRELFYKVFDRSGDKTNIPINDFFELEQKIIELIR